MSRWIYYASGSNEPGQMVGFASVGQPFGISVDAVGSPTRRDTMEYVSHAYPEAQIFVDSGAFSEVDAEGVVVKPISDAGWVRRLALMEEIAKIYGERALVIAPDRIGDQVETLRRLRRYAPRLQRIERLGASVALPLQGGPVHRSTFYRRARRASGLSDPAASFPMNKQATTPREIGRFLREHPEVKRIHLMGMGPLRNRELRIVLAQEAPDVQWSFDSNLWRSQLGSRQRPGIIMRSVDLARADIEADALSQVVEGSWAFDDTELLPDPSSWIPYVISARAIRPSLDAYRTYLAAELRARSTKSPEALRRWEQLSASYQDAARQVAGELGLSRDEARVFLSDPSGFLHQSGADGYERWSWDTRFFAPGSVTPYERLYQELVGLGTAQLRKSRAIRRAYRIKLAVRPAQQSLLDLVEGHSTEGDEYP